VRPQTGCTPYIEYVTDFVLPRVLKSKTKEDGIYFATPADKSRLVTRALEVIDAVLTRYVPPAAVPFPRHPSEPNLVPENTLVIRNSSLSHANNFTKQLGATKQRPTEHTFTQLSKGPLGLVASSIYPKNSNSEQIIEYEIDFTEELAKY
jgi:hypothetical protein